MPSSIKLNSHERDALQGLPHLARSAYVELRAVMDFHTGTAGRRFRIAWSTIRRACFVRPMPGVPGGGLPSEPRIKRAVAHLLYAGLLVKRTEGNRLIFHFPLAEKGGQYLGQDVTKKVKQADPNPTQGRHIQAVTQADPFEAQQGDTPSKPSTAFDALGFPASGATQADTANDVQADSEVDRGEDGLEPTQADPSLVSAIRGSSSKYLATRPRARVGFEPWLSALADLSQELRRFVFNLSPARLNTVLPLLGEWADAGLLPDDLADVARSVHDGRPDLLSFGPEYLRGPMADLLAEKHDHGGQATAAKVQQDQPGSNAARSTYLSPAESLAEDRADWQAWLRRGKALGLIQLPDENEVEFVERIRVEAARRARPATELPRSEPIPVGEMLRSALRRPTPDADGAGPS